MGPSGESYRLLNLTPSHDEDEEQELEERGPFNNGSAHRRDPWMMGSTTTSTTTNNTKTASSNNNNNNNHISASVAAVMIDAEGERGVPDLNLPLATKTLTMRQKVKRKIRLKKRRDRNQSTHHRLGSLSSASSSSSTSLLVGSAKFPPSSSVCSSLSTMGTGLAITMAFVVLTFFVAQLHVTLSNLRLEMERVSEDRQAFLDRFSDLQAQLQVVASEAQGSTPKISTLEAQFAGFINQISLLNESMIQVEASLRTAPELVELPQQLHSIQNEMAKFGSRLTEVESRLNSKGGSQSEDHLSLLRSTSSDEFTSLRNETFALKHSLGSLEERFRTIGIKITSQMKTNEERSEKLWENMAKFRDEIDALKEIVDANSSSGTPGMGISGSLSNSGNKSLSL